MFTFRVISLHTFSFSEKVDEIVKSDIWFHFKEGFSNAVRRSVYIKDLLQ